MEEYTKRMDDVRAGKVLCEKCNKPKEVWGGIWCPRCDIPKPKSVG